MQGFLRYSKIMIHERKKKGWTLLKSKLFLKDIIKQIQNKPWTWRKYLQSIHLNVKHTSNIALYSKYISNSQNKQPHKKMSKGSE